MRWMTALLALVAGVGTYGIVLQQRLVAQVAGLSEDLRALREAPLPLPLPVTLDADERELFARIVAARDARPAPAAPPQAKLASREEPAAPREPGPAARAAADQAERIVDAALSTGTLRADDTLQLRDLLTRADPAKALALRRRIGAALNRDELRPADPTVRIP
jgi:hypothetical protein